MKNILITISILLFTGISAWAQPSFIIGDNVGDNGETVCVDFEVRDFTLITSMQSVVFFWDPTELTFVDVQNFLLPGLDATNFVVDNAAGTLTMNWEDANCMTGPSSPGITVLDGTVLFEMCFSILGTFGDVADINIVADPQPVIQRESDCMNIFSFRNTGHIYTGVTPVVFSATDVSGNTDDLVCMDVKVEGFEDMASGQFTLIWDETIATVDHVSPGNIENLASSSFNFTAPGILTMSWASLPGQPITVPDSTSFFEVCFRLVGECETNTQLLLGLTPTALEFTNENVPGQLIPTFFRGGGIEVGSCDQNGLQLFADCGGEHELNDEFCVPVTVGDNFQDISDMSFLINWSPSILEFQGVQNVNGGIIGLGGGSFNSSNSGNGVLGVDWARMPGGFPNESLDAGAVLFEACFTVVGLGGNSPFNFIQNNSNVQVADGPNIGINPNNCEVIVNQPDQVIMQLGTGEAATGDEFCIPVEITHFQDIISYQFQLNWDATLYEFTGVSNINIPGVTEMDHFVTGIDALLFDWESLDPVTLADGSSIFELCFTPLAGPGNCTDIFMVNGGILAPEAISSTSNGENIGVVSTPGELCTLFPEGFGLTANDTVGDWNANVCMDFSVESFDNITGATFTINWDVSAMTYTGVNDFSVLNGLVFDDFNATVGALNVTWTDAVGVAVPDDTDIFQVCFDLVGAPRDCYPVTINNSQSPPEVTTSAGPGSLVIGNGEICIDEHFYITNTEITPVTCYDACDGTITLEVLSSQGTTGLNFQWNNPPQFTAYQAINLCEGEVSVTISDNGTPRYSQDFTFDIPIVDNLPTADAGDDAELNCVPGLVPITGTGSEGDNFGYSWVRLPMELVSPSTSAFASEAGFYAFVVEDTETGCTVSDTIQVFPAIYPDALAGDDELYNCISDTIKLNGEGSTEGATIVYDWTVVSGTEAGIVAGEEGLIDPGVLGPGEYQIEVTDLLNGCSREDIVAVEDFRDFPDATANFGLDSIPLACDTTVALNADASIMVNPAVVTYQWYNVLNEPIMGSSTIPVGDLGVYYLVATNPVSMCEASDTIRVIANEDFPQITTLLDTMLTCAVDTIQLTTSIEAGGEDFSFTWSSLSGGPIIAGTEDDLSPLVNLPGLYQIEATNTATNCAATAEINIGIDTIAPIANAGLDTIITCINNEIMLDGSGSDQGENIIYTWTNEAGGVIGAAITTTVTEAGIYCLEVTNILTGCSSTDCVNVVANNIDPEVVISEPNQSFTCLVDTLTLMPDSIVPMSDDYTFEWVATLGTIIGTTDGISIQTEEEGVYRLTVTNSITGCSGVNEFVVNTDIVLPVANAGDDADLTCANPSILIGDETTEMGAGIEYQWTNIVDGETPTPNDEKMATVSVAGTYELVVTNTNTGCVAADTIVVGVDMTPPAISTDVSGMITCADECIQVIVMVDGVDVFDVSWQGLNGEPVTDNTSAEATVCTAGMYEVSVIDQSNGCESKDTVTVMDDIEMTEILVDDIEDFKCSTDGVTIDASATGAEADFSSIVWTTETGNTITPATGSLIVEVNGSGEYTLTVTRTDNGCESSTLISVNDDTERPIADAGMDALVDCGGTEMLSGIGSSQGADFVYEWTVLTGAGTLSGDLTGLVTSVEGEGTYQLLVTDNSNGCFAMDTVASILQYPDPALTMEDVTICNDSMKITANLPAGVTGLWTPGAFVQLVDPTSNVTTATELSSGQNRFIWTLSADGCPDYSSDTLLVFSEGNPIANNDILGLAEGESSGMINIVANDIVSNPASWEITILTNPEVGVIDSLVNGVVYYSVGAGVSGDTEFEYMICSLDCPDKCDEGTVLITIPISNNEIETPNTITPNDDGINDVFFIEQIANNPEDKYPDNEIIIFNRWGDIVYQAKPYNNDWKGTNQSGQDLPEATYYYLLRLNISEGEILKGDITIVR